MDGYPLTPETFFKFELYCEASPPTFHQMWIISHPLISCAVVYDRDDKQHTAPPVILTKNDEAFKSELKKKLAWLRGNCKTLDALLFVYTSKPYRLDMLDWLSKGLPSKVYSAMLADAWTDVEYPCQNGTRKLVEMFKRSEQKYLMNKAEKKVFQSLPDPITIYRGLQGGKARIRGLSWTTSFEIAHWFGGRFHQKAPVVYQAQIRKEGAFAYFEGRNEEEIVVNPSMLRKIERAR